MEPRKLWPPETFSLLITLQKGAAGRKQFEIERGLEY